jgi:hypothetical protein
MSNRAEQDDSYAETQSSLRDQVPVQGDDEQVEDPIQDSYADSDQQLGKPMSFLMVNSSVIRLLTRYREGRERGDQ